MFYPKLNYCRNSYNHLQVNIYPLTIDVLKPFESLDAAAKWKEMEILDFDYKLISELEKYIKITNIESDRIMDVPKRTFDSKAHSDIKETNNLFWSLVDSYAEIVF